MTTKACVVDGYNVASDTIVYVNLWAIGRDPNFWQNPDEFLPERFLNTGVDFKGQDFGFLPLDTGEECALELPWICRSGEGALANLLYSFDWELPTGMVEDDVDMDSSPGVVTLKRKTHCVFDGQKLSIIKLSCHYFS
ncbi:UNVERIFIED_CONTAM: cytochrome [Sesamum radiatum]|uniref:Cytochrome n=1 Tax=Sesamum radiatum TaxID=300843 RepID=A0AAW2S704_SESRA